MEPNKARQRVSLVRFFCFLSLAQIHLARLELYSEAEWITRLRLVIRERVEPNKARQRVSLVRFFFLLSLAQIHLARSKKQKPTGKCRRALFVGDTGFEPVTSCLSSKRSKPTELITRKMVGMTGLEPATTRPPDVYSTT